VGHEEGKGQPREAWRHVEKHGVTFEEAEAVLGDDEGDRYHLEEFDDEHAMEEDRYITFGSHPDDRTIVLRISWTDRSVGEDKVTRIISARHANNSERERYVDELNSR
jgi:uncharacterized DUF497 family protein